MLGRRVAFHDVFLEKRVRYKGSISLYTAILQEDEEADTWLKHGNGTTKITITKTAK